MCLKIAFFWQIFGTKLELKEIFMIIDIQKEKLGTLRGDFTFIKECL